MTFPPNMPRPRNLRFGIATVAALGLLVAIPVSAQAAAVPVPLGTAGSFVVLAGGGVTNTGPTTLNGDLGTFPTTSISGLGTVTLHGTNHAGDAVTQSAKNDLVTAYNAAAKEGPTSPISGDLTGKTLKPGVYNSASSIGLTGALTLDAQGNKSAVFVFQAGSTLTTGSGSTVKLINGASSCNVFWQLGTSGTIGTGSHFVGTILANSAITVTTKATVQGRVLARSGAVTLDSNTIGNTPCVVGATQTALATASPRPQVSVAPAGAVRTGDGSTSGGNNTQGILTGSLILAGAGGVTFVAARRRRLNS